MADQKISELTALTGANVADDDAIAIVDTSATETKKIVFSELKNALDTATGFVRITGDTMTGNLNMGDNVKAIFGAGSDLSVYHDGTRSHIEEAGLGGLWISTNGTEIKLKQGGGVDEEMLVATPNGSVDLYYNNNLKLATTSTGIDVTGTVTADGLTVDGNTVRQNGTLPFYLFMETDTTDLNTQLIQTVGEFRIRTVNDAVTTSTERLRIDHSTGDISFYEDTGTTAKFFWDASAESLGIGVTPSDWDVLPAIQVSTYGGLSAGGGYTRLSSNAYLSTYPNTWSYIATNTASLYEQVGGQHIWSNAASGTAGNAISFSEAMRIDSSGLIKAVSSITSDPTDTGAYWYNKSGVGPTLSGYQFSVRTGGTPTEAMRIDSSGNVLINTSTHTPTDTELVVSSEYSASGTTDAGITFSARQSGNWRNSGIFANGDALTFTTGDTGLNGAISTSEKMRIDSSGNLLVGGTDTFPHDNAATSGTAIGASGYLSVARSGGISGYFNRMTSDGDIVQFRKDGTTVGSIGTEVADTTLQADLYIHGRSTVGGTNENNSRLWLLGGDSGIVLDGHTNAILPTDENSYEDARTDIGSEDYRFKDLYLSNGIVGNSNSITISTDGGTTDHVTVDTSGNLLVGKTSVGYATDGFEARASGYASVSDTDTAPFLINRNGTTNGNLIAFYKSGAAVGSIGVSGNDFYVTGSATNIAGTYFANSKIMPMRSGATSDNTIDLGTNSKRFKNLYLSAIGYFGHAGIIGTGNVGVNIREIGQIRIGRSGTSSATQVSFSNGNGEVGTIATSGSATAYNTSSDYRLKTDAQPMTGATDRLKQLNPVNFEWIADGTRVDGFLAHEAQAVVPESVTGVKDAMRDEEYEVTPAVTDDDGNVITEAVMGTRSVPDYQGIDQSKLVPLLVATIKELEARITALENA